VAHPQIAAFARLAKGPDAPARTLAGQETKLSRTMHDIRYSSSRDEIFVTNPFAQAILAFRGDVNGNQAPLRVIQGPKTHLTEADTLEIDDVNKEIYVPIRDAILVFPMEGNGDVAPIRIVHSPPNGWRPGAGIAVDPVHNLLITDGTDLNAKNQDEGRDEGRARNSILIFDRTANGDTKPLRVIQGPHTGLKGIRQMQVYPKGGWIVVAHIANGVVPEPQGAFVGVWSINDSGDVPPRWKIDAKAANGLKKPRGVALNPKNKELIVSDMRQNAVLTYYFPEMF
jgi:DNA-binding beta-propeller fold protein YncE